MSKKPKLKPYVMTWRGGAPADGKHKESYVTLFGPFKSTKIAVKWGESWQEANEDDPRWHVMSFSRKRVGANTLLVPVIQPITSGGNP